MPDPDNRKSIQQVKVKTEAKVKRGPNAACSNSVIRYRRGLERNRIIMAGTTRLELADIIGNHM
jgi:hypothetical protein